MSCVESCSSPALELEEVLAGVASPIDGLRHVFGRFPLPAIQTFEEQLERYFQLLPPPPQISMSGPAWERMRTECACRASVPVFAAMTSWIRDVAPELTELICVASARQLVARGAASAAAAELRLLAWGLLSHRPERPGRAMVAAEIGAMLVRIADLLEATNGKEIRMRPSRSFFLPETHRGPEVLTRALSIVVAHLDRSPRSEERVEHVVESDPLLYPHFVLIAFAARAGTLRYARQIAASEDSGPEWTDLADAVDRFRASAERITGRPLDL